LGDTPYQLRTSRPGIPASAKVGTSGSSASLFRDAMARILVGGPVVFKGYLGSDEATREALDD
jgi:long-subunit acyl-CoA synthetase (AMP-forming)